MRFSIWKNASIQRRRKKPSKGSTQCVNISIDLWRDGKPKTYMSFLLLFGWSDLGTWASAYETLGKDYLENAVAGDHAMVIDAMRNMVHAGKR